MGENWKAVLKCYHIRYRLENITFYMLKRFHVTIHKYMNCVIFRRPIPAVLNGEGGYICIPPKSYPCNRVWRPIVGLWDIIDNRLTDGGEVSLTSRLLFTPRKIPGTHFCQRLSRPQGHSAAGRIRSIKKKSNDLIGNRTCDLPACSSASTNYAILCPLYITRGMFPCVGYLTTLLVFRSDIVGWQNDWEMISSKGFRRTRS
jgi:hypothetical protein